MATPEFVVVGHVVRDLLADGWRLGGTAAFAALQALRLGVSVGVVTRAGPDIALDEALPGVAVAGRPSKETTCFENVYEGGRRRQRVPAQAEPLGLEDIPEDWRPAPAVLVGPVCGEVPPGLAADFSGPLVGVSAQGWLRRLDTQFKVRKEPWRGDPFWAGCDVVFVSEEDIESARDQLDRWTADVPIVALTADRRGASVHCDGAWRRIDAFPTNEVDPTGAGDVFAAAFLVRYRETNDIATTMRFACAAATSSIEAAGTSGIATREQIETRMAQHPEIVLR